MVTTLGLDRKEERLRRYVHVLQLLAETDTKLNKNGIWLQLKGQELGSEPTILYAIDDLEKWGMIKEVKTKKIVPGGKTFNYFKLTRTGIENLISAGILLTKSITVSTAKLFLQKYRELLPYAAEISDLWPVFAEAKVEDIGIRRLAIFIRNFHGEQLIHHVRNEYGPFVNALLLGEHEIRNWMADHLRKKGVQSSLQCTADDDVEAFLDPLLSCYRVDASLRNANDELERWITAIGSSEKVQAIVVRIALKQAGKVMQSNNGVLRQLGVKSVTLRIPDVETYGKLMAEIDFLRSRIVTPSS
jgi:hypothetical protein